MKTKKECTEHKFYIEEVSEGLFKTCQKCGFTEGCVYNYLSDEPLVEVPTCEWTKMLIDIGGDG